MSTLLYITANPQALEKSYSLAVGHEFIEAYKVENPEDIIIHIDLYKEHIPQIDADVLNGWGKLTNGAEFNQLSNEEQAKVSRLQQLAEQFVAADKYVFVSPLWNLSIPPMLKAYIDSFCVEGKAFRYTATGPTGLLMDKKALHIQASGGIYSNGPAACFENGHSYLKKIIQFVGIPALEAIIIEGMAYQPDQALTIKEKAITEAVELARSF